jgi:hypothetical protein
MQACAPQHTLLAAWRQLLQCLGHELLVPLQWCQAAQVLLIVLAACNPVHGWLRQQLLLLPCLPACRQLGLSPVQTLLTLLYTATDT